MHYLPFFVVLEESLGHLSGRSINLSFHIRLTKFLILSFCRFALTPPQLPGTWHLGALLMALFWSFRTTHAFLLSLLQAISIITFPVVVRVTELVPSNEYIWVNAVDLRCSSFVLQPEASRTEQKLSFFRYYQEKSLSSLTLVCYPRRQGFNRQTEGAGNINTGQQRANGSPNPSPTTFAPTMPPFNQSSSFSSNTGPSSDNVANNAEQSAAAEPPKFFFREKYAKLGVKGNFMPLAAQPANVDLADWLAHQSL